MADHLRKQIREAVVTLVTGLTTTGANVSDSRVYAVEQANTPALLVYPGNEAVEVDTLTPPRGQTRTLEIIIEGIVRDISEPEDTLDLIAKEVEVAMGADITVGGLAKFANLIQIETRLDGQGDKPLGNIALTYDITYRVAETAPDATI